jgi:hypothetical protein
VLLRPAFSYPWARGLIDRCIEAEHFFERQLSVDVTVRRAFRE